MKPWKRVVRHARTSLIVLATLLSLGLILALSSHTLEERARSDLAASAAELNSLQTRRSEVRADLRYMQSHLEHFKRLTQVGLIGTPEREAWVEQLTLSAKNAGFSDSLRYTLHAPKPLSPSATAVTLASSSDRHGPKFHDLEFNLSGVHEEELLGLLQDFGRHTRGRFRVNACQLMDPTPAGLKLKCVLRFFTLAQDDAAPASGFAPATVAAPDSAPRPHLGTLFYHPAERSAMVLERRGDAVQEFSQQARVSGIVQRERGNSTTWINSRSLVEGQPFAPATVTHVSADAVTFNGQRVRVGETLDLRTGASTDILPAGALAKEARE